MPGAAVLTVQRTLQRRMNGFLNCAQSSLFQMPCIPVYPGELVGQSVRPSHFQMTAILGQCTGYTAPGLAEWLSGTKNALFKQSLNVSRNLFGFETNN